MDDIGKDLAGVQALQRKQDDVERDMTALHAQLQVTYICTCRITGGRKEARWTITFDLLARCGRVTLI